MLLFLIFYCLLLLLVGAYAARFVKQEQDFFVAGRSLSTGLVFSTFLAANLGAGSTVGAAEYGYTSGLQAWWWVGSAGIGSLLLAFVIGPRIHRLARNLNLYTVGDYLEVRYGKATRLTVAVILYCGSPAILAGQIIALGLILHVVSGIRESGGMILGGAVATIYFTMGGLQSTAWVNKVQVGVKAAGFLTACCWMFFYRNSWGELQTIAPDLDYLSLGGAGTAGTVQLLLMLAPAFMVSPGLIQKLYGARDEQAVRLGVGLQGATLIGFAFLPVLLGMAARIYMPGLEDPGLALPRLCAEFDPQWLGALLLAAIFSAEVSSADAVLFMMTTSLVRDVLEPLGFNKNSQSDLLPLARKTALVVGVLGIILAHLLSSVLAALRFFYSLLTVTLFVPLLAGLFQQRANQTTALLSIFCSLSVAGYTHWIAGATRSIWLQPVPAGITAGAIAYLCALLVQSKRQSVL